MRKRCLNTVYEVAKTNKDVVFIGSDLGVGTLDEFRRELPDQFIMEGISEQHIVSMACGMAMSGKIVYFNTIATFITRRCFEQNIVDLGLDNSNVRLIGNGGGLVYAPLGPTHLAFEDIAIMKTIPNMTIIVCSDADEMERAVKKSEKYQGPIYFRVAKGGDPIVSSPDQDFEIGKAIVHKEAGDVLLVATGVMVSRALEVARNFEKKGIKVGVLNVHTIKPLDNETLLDQMKDAKVIISLEEHTIIGGLGSSVAELVAENSRKLNSPSFLRMGLQDLFPARYGSQNSMINYYGFDVPHIEKNINEMLAEIN